MARGVLLGLTAGVVIVLLAGGAWWWSGGDLGPLTRDGKDSAVSDTKSDATSDARPDVAPLDLDVLDWRNATIPGELCRHQGSIRLRDGSATNVSSSFDGPEPNFPQDVSAFTDEVVYGDLTGDGRLEAALPVICANHNSTAAGQRALGVMVFDGSDGRLQLIGTLVSQQPRLGEPPNFVHVEKITRGTITATETFYGSADANCCPTGEADSVWKYIAGKLIAAGSDVQASPSPMP